VAICVKGGGGVKPLTAKEFAALQKESVFTG
jgi:hypothetical protein